MKKSEYELLGEQWDADAMEIDPAVLERSVLYDKHPEKPIAFVTFNVPERLNALPIASLERIGDLVKEAEVDDDVKVIVFRGEGPCFGTGADASELGHYIGYGKGKDRKTRRRPAQRQRMLPDRNLIFGAFTNPIADCLKATISQVHGYCYGGHMQIALATDLVIASPDALFTHPAFRYLGAAPQDMYAWIENLGLKKMKEIMLTMRPLEALEAEQIGFVNKVVPREDLDRWVDDYATAITMMPLDGIMMGKAMMQMVMEARGKGVGEMTGWVGHGWATNLVLEEGEFNFLRERRDKGLARTLRERDEAVAPFFRLGGRMKRTDSEGSST